MRNIISFALLATTAAFLLSACTTPLAGSTAGVAAERAPPRDGAAIEARAPVTSLVSIDGMHPDYLTRGVTPNLSRLAGEGVTAALRPAWPTKTFPNHYSIVTGLVPDRHGIVGNRFVDPQFPDEIFTLPRLEPHWWDQAEPIWVTAEKAGIRTATMFWPGSNSKVRGTYPSDWQQFNQEVSERQRVDAVIDWLRRPAATRPKFVTLYFDTVDTAGHRHGPDAVETNAAIANADMLIGRLLDELEGLGQPANLIITSDHGMAQTSASRVIRLQDIADPSLYQVIEGGPYAALEPTPGNEAKLSAALLRPHANMECWARGTMPVRFKYGSNPRTPAFVCLAESGWTVTDRPVDPNYGGGAHGYDNRDPAMLAAFVAHGPAIARGRTLPTGDNVDVYPLLRRLMGLSPATGIDGDDALIAALD